MNKNLKKIILFSILIATLFSFLGCQDVIYDNIRKEVSLEDGTISGNVRSLVRFKCDGTEYLYLTNGSSIYRKNLEKHQSYGDWEDLSPKGLGDFILQLAADEDCLYALSARWTEHSDTGQNRWYGRYIYYSPNGVSWRLVTMLPTSSEYESGYSTTAVLFCTNTIKTENRKAYFSYNKGATVYRLVKNQIIADTEATAKKAVSCAAIGEKVYFFSTDYSSSSPYSSSACTNETKNSDGTVYYYSYKSTLYSAKDGTELNHTGAGSIIYSVAVTSDYIIVGTKEGIKHFGINSDGSIGDEADFATNAAAIMTSAYEVNALIVVYPEKPEVENTIYAAVDFEGRNQQFNHICIWAYYPERGNWNRD